MSIHPKDVLFYAGGECFAKFGVPYLRQTRAQGGLLTFTRSGAVGPFVDSDGVLRQASANRVRIEWVDLDGDGIRETPGLLLETSGTNLCLQSEDFGTTWSAVGTPTRSAAAHTASGVTLDLIGDDDGAAAEYYEQTISFTGDGSKAISIFVKEGTSPNANGSLIVVRDTTAGAYRLRATVTWSDGVPSVAIAEGAQRMTPELYSDGVYRLHLSAAGVVAANTNRVRVYPTTETASETGNVYAGGVQCENRSAPMSYVKTTTGTVTRSADTLYFDWHATPQAMAGYVKFIERGTILTNAARLFHIGSATGSSDPRFNALNNSGNYAGEHDNGTTAPVATLSAAPSLGDLVELRPVLNADGSVLIGQSIDEATESTASTGTTATLGDEWAGRRLYFNSRGSTAGEAMLLLSAAFVAGASHTLSDLRAVYPFGAAS